MKQEEILFLLGSACVVVFAWIAFTIIHTSLTSTISSSITSAITPIGQTFDTKTISAMNKRTAVTPLTIIQPQSETDIVVTTAPVASQGGSL